MAAALSSLPSATLAGRYLQPSTRAGVSVISALPRTGSNRFPFPGNTSHQQHWTALDELFQRRQIVLVGWQKKSKVLQQIALYVGIFATGLHYPYMIGLLKVLIGFSNTVKCLRYAIDLHRKHRAATVFLSNVNPSSGDSSKDETSSTSSTGGPPLLTILAGVLVFLLVCWVVGSIVMWLISLVVNVPPSK